MHRGDSLDGLPEQFRQMALQVQPPHRDLQYQSYVTEEEKRHAQTLTFTLPLKVGPLINDYKCII